jgi:hypothetical protein
MFFLASVTTTQNLAFPAGSILGMPKGLQASINSTVYS